MNTTLKIFQHMAGIAEGHASLSFDELSLYAPEGTNGIPVINRAGEIFGINARRSTFL
ncbi:hypothetical protein JWZ98_06180 [Methylomonas sp. EFPC1]|uniref:hypothetical protein n=1 Tax=unclassified Methylomonas TaxID=2608980 RepID=UPI0013EE4BCC|nr:MULTISPECIES: hypothetical protein [unclassified Methylomonas]QSB02528.1 hypothetical protein JWZ98_06180 [Methylomonas sp. EFPC1]